VQEGQALAAELNAKRPNSAWFIKCDVSKMDEIESMINAVVAKYGRIDCLINNAGWHPPTRTIDQFSIQDFRDLLELNLVSIFAACKFALPHLRKVQGNIINMSSLVGTIAQPYATTYVATKGAITAFTKALAIDEASYRRARQQRFSRQHLHATLASRHSTPRLTPLRRAPSAMQHS